MSDLGLPGDPAEGRRRRAAGSFWRRALVYFGLAEDDPANPLFPPAEATASRAGIESDALAEVLQKLDAQEAAIAELRAEVERLRDRER